MSRLLFFLVVGTLLVVGTTRGESISVSNVVLGANKESKINGKWRDLGIEESESRNPQYRNLEANDTTTGSVVDENGGLTTTTTIPDSIPDSISDNVNSTDNKDYLNITYPSNCEYGHAGGLRLGDTAIFCVFVSTKPPKKMVFKLKVDQYTSMTLKGIQKLSKEFIKKSNAASGSLHTWVSTTSAAGGSAHPLHCDIKDGYDKYGLHTGYRRNRVSCPQIYWTHGENGLLVPFVSLVVNIHEGNIISLFWDNLCANCASSECVYSHAGIDGLMSPIGSLKEKSGTCATSVLEKDQDFKIFVTWSGTDTKGLHAKSASLRFSQFAGATLQTMWTWTKDKYSQNWY